MVERIAAGNWKMNGSQQAMGEIKLIADAAEGANCTTLICPPAPYINQSVQTADGSELSIGGQDCHANASGAHTGDIAAAMLADLGAKFVILGHSERRADHAENDALIASKVATAQTAGIRPIVCVGETLEEREAGKTLEVVGTQLVGSLNGADPIGLVVAYEPVWAIGTGKNATPDLIAEVHTALRHLLIDLFGDAGANVPLLYGGSVKAGNAADIFAVDHVNGALVGGASLTAADFAPIITALSDA